MGLQTTRPPLLMYGVLCIISGIAMYVFGVMFALPRFLLGNGDWLRAVNEWIVWYSGVPLMVGLCLSLVDLLILLGGKRAGRVEVRYEPVADHGLVVALTAYNDEASIAAAVQDFRCHPAVREVIVVDNNSRDQTKERAIEAGATALSEPRQGYGSCVYRCLQEALARDSQLIVLCEGDCTFRAYDLGKFLAYLPHADVVNGTRTVECLRAQHTQLSTFMYYGNLFVGKLLEAKHLGRSTITDVGTTYKVCRHDALARIMPHLDPRVNLEFNAHFLDVALQQGCEVVECPITFHPRVGLSKGGNVNNSRAVRVGLRMMLGIVWGWTPLVT